MRSLTSCKMVCHLLFASSSPSSYLLTALEEIHFFKYWKKLVALISSRSKEPSVHFGGFIAGCSLLIRVLRDVSFYDNLLLKVLKCLSVCSILILSPPSSSTSPVLSQLTLYKASTERLHKLAQAVPEGRSSLMDVIVSLYLHKDDPGQNKAISLVAADVLAYICSRTLSSSSSLT